MHAFKVFRSLQEERCLMMGSDNPHNWHLILCPIQADLLNILALYVVLNFISF